MRISTAASVCAASIRAPSIHGMDTRQREENARYLPALQPELVLAAQKDSFFASQLAEQLAWLFERVCGAPEDLQASTAHTRFGSNNDSEFFEGACGAPRDFFAGVCRQRLP